VPCRLRRCERLARGVVPVGSGHSAGDPCLGRALARGRGGIVRRGGVRHPTGFRGIQPLPDRMVLVGGLVGIRPGALPLLHLADSKRQKGTRPDFSHD
jgi:hypothetical protein